MFPWLAHGHISPFLELAKKLCKRNFTTYFCSTPINMCSIKEQLSGMNSSPIQLVELHLPAIPKLPPHYHTTKNLPPHLMPTLKAAFDMSKPTFYNILKTLKPDLLIYDFIQPWVPAVASCHNIPAICFLSTGAATQSFFHHTQKNPRHEFPFPAIYLQEHEEPIISKMVNSYSNGLTDKDRSLQSIDQSSSIVLIKTLREIEAKYIDYGSSLAGKEMVPVGPLVQESVDDDNHKKFIQWLSKKDQSSVVFVSFGSEYFLSKEEIEEVAHGLEFSTMNFIWVVRFPEGERVGYDEALPEGFLRRVGGKGMVVEDWAPQAKILQHSSVGGFVSHCGCSSVMEGMKFGVPIIAMPMHLDQPLNARLVVEFGVGMEVKREKGGDGKFKGQEVGKVIKEVVLGKEGKEVRRRAKDMRQRMLNIGEKELDVVVEKLVQLCKKNSDET